MKKFLSIIAVTALSMSLLSGCQSDREKTAAEIEIEKNTSMESKATKICTKIYKASLIVSGILILLCIVVKGPFWGQGIHFGNIFDRFTYDINTILANLMVRSIFISVYMFMVNVLVFNMTCRVNEWMKVRG